MMHLPGHTELVPPHRRYDAVAEASAALVIRSYSSSFGLASRLLAPAIRRDVRNIYALVRVADEIVDAPRPEQGLVDRSNELDQLEDQTSAAMITGSSSNLVVHAFARTARRVGIDLDLVAPFFASMRSDLTEVEHDFESLASYIYGSAEVVGLMCLRAFLAEEAKAEARYDHLAPGARRLGAAFQKINFLRDFGEDSDGLGRRYLVGLDPDSPDDAAWSLWLDDIDLDLTAAAAAIPHLPASSRVAVCTAHDLFAELTARLRESSAAEARLNRVRVPNAGKARIAAAAVARRGMPRTARGVDA
ncbi:MULTISPECIES: phytoene/squalene synthase family protein [Gordonia]|jgi:phytoene/squalene synthetase|uniref:Phytoene synthase n=2 Tax=Gordonia alkanivorans TaxID=84096 RepID=F9VT95_9ACTN|nr:MULTISPECIES: squalene/phytoene synthase family protein [Gordonia]ETA08384.1 phytoene synthase [Gordonia alkanivorans CGMCC 6845]MDH3005943.1 squalene/phytoene synthase family protein [Gordonia alkanivorans]MDH3011261.1 squalene/phytoene synthase family protein [Gordonia alkanivorans]MDH3015698.1 squalene/phytoene synthase family protein [Gordonia alkanivorans]MDH3020852.1 squalene/phytoene synthase family protein [Gordonia alkanivorans]